MTEDRLIELGEAIKSFYRVEPLKNDLEAAIARRLADVQEQEALITDKALYLFIGLIAAGSTIYCVAISSSFSISQVLLVLGILVSLICVSVVELLMFSKRLSDLISRQ